MCHSVMVTVVSFTRRGILCGNRLNEKVISWKIEDEVWYIMQTVYENGRNETWMKK